MIFIVLEKIRERVFGGFGLLSVFFGFLDGKRNGEATFFVSADAFEGFAVSVAEKFDEGREEILIFVKIATENVNKFVGVEKGAKYNIYEKAFWTFTAPIPSRIFAADVTTFEDFVVFFEVFAERENHADLKFGERTQKAKIVDFGA